MDNPYEWPKLCGVGSIIYCLLTAILTNMPNSFIFSIQIGSCHNYPHLVDEWRPPTHTRDSDLATRDVNTIRNWQALSIRKYRHSAESCEFYVSVFILFSFVRTYVFHVLRTYVIILCNWLILWQNALYLYLGRFRMCLNTSRNHVSRSSVEAFKSIQEKKTESAELLKLNS